MSAIGPPQCFPARSIVPAELVSLRHAAASAPRVIHSCPTPPLGCIAKSTLGSQPSPVRSDDKDPKYVPILGNDLVATYRWAPAAAAAATAAASNRPITFRFSRTQLLGASRFCRGRTRRAVHRRAKHPCRPRVPQAVHRSLCFSMQNTSVVPVAPSPSAKRLSLGCCLPLSFAHYFYVSEGYTWCHANHLLLIVLAVPYNAPRYLVAVHIRHGEAGGLLRHVATTTTLPTTPSRRERRVHHVAGRGAVRRTPRRVRRSFHSPTLARACLPSSRRRRRRITGLR